MRPFYPNYLKTLWSKFLFLIPIFIIIACSLDKKVTGTVDETDTGIVAMLYNPDETPAIGANVKIFKAADTTKIPVSEVISDKNGNYSVRGLSKGIYNVYAEKGSFVAFQDSVKVLEDTVLIKDDTLETPINLSGIVGLQPNHDPRTVTVQVLGTDIYSNVNENGYFTLSRMAKGNFSLKLSTNLDNYTSTYKNITLDKDTPDTLSDTLWLIYTGIPIVEGLKAIYDTLNGVMTLSWNATKYRDFQDYLIYRDYFDSLNMRSTPIAHRNDTSFIDTIYDKSKSTGTFSFSDTNDYHFKYRVIIRNNSQEVGVPYKYMDVIAAAPKRVEIVIQHKSFHLRKHFYTDSTTINDSMRFEVNLTSPTRTLSEITYKELESDYVIKRIVVDGRHQVADTLYHTWDQIGQKNIEISVLDVAGTISFDTIVVEVIRDMPKIMLTNTLVMMGVPFELKGVDNFGEIESLTVDTNKYIQFEKAADSIIKVIIRDTLTDSFMVNCTITDDDGNHVKQSIYFSIGLNWEKIADNFLSTQTIHAVVELNNTLFAFVTPLNSDKRKDKTFQFSLYSSSDAINWSKVVDSLPWSHWFSKPTVHNNQIFLIESMNDSTDTNKIWYSSNGVEWVSEKPGNFPKWFPHQTGSNSLYLREMFFVRLDGKLWAGELYCGNGFIEFYTSSNGIDWTNVSKQFTPPNIGMSDQIHPQYLVVENKLYFVTDLYASTGFFFYETTDFINHNLLISTERFRRSNGGANGLPVPVVYLNKLFLCSSEPTKFGEFMVYMNSNNDFSNVFPYPGSLVHCCIVFNNRLYSISNNGVYAIK